MKRQNMLKGLLAVAIVGCIGSVTSAAMIVQLVAVPGAGYVVTDGGKTVTITGSPTVINMQLTGTVGTGASNDAILNASGNIFTTATGGGAVTAGSIALSNVPAAFTNLGFSGGVSQELTTPPDGVLDLGRTGTRNDLGGNTNTWTGAGGSNANYITFVQNLVSPAATGNVVFGNVALNVTSLGGGETQVQWAYRDSLAAQLFQEGGQAVSEKTFGGNVLGGAPVTILIPEPGMLGLASLGLLGLVARRRRTQ